MNRHGERRQDQPPVPLRDEPGEGEQDTGGGAELHKLAGLICHRAKNDLQTVANLVSLAASHVRRPADMVEALEGRVGALSVSYSLVSQRGAPPCLDHLAEEVVRRSKWRLATALEVKNDLPSLELSLRLCSPLSLWLHEMVVNALEHGLARAQRPVLALAGGLSGDGFHLSVMDNGPGLPPGFDPAVHGRFGLRVAQAVAESDLRGRMALLPMPDGTNARLEMPVHEFQRLNRSTWD